MDGLELGIGSRRFWKTKGISCCKKRSEHNSLKMKRPSQKRSIVLYSSNTSVTNDSKAKRLVLEKREGSILVFQCGEDETCMTESNGVTQYMSRKICNKSFLGMSIGKSSQNSIPSRFLFFLDTILIVVN